MSIYSATAKKRTSVSYGSGGGSSGGSSGSSSGRRPIDYSSIGGGSSGSSSGTSGAASSGGGSSGGSGNSNYYVSNPDNTMMSTGTPTSPGRVAANSYESGKVTTEKDAYGGEYKTSPNGQVSYHDANGNVTILHSNNNKELIGHTFYTDGTSTMDKPVETVDPSAKYSYTYKGEYDNVGRHDPVVRNPLTGVDTDNAYSMQVEALQTAMNNNREALEAAYNESELALNNAIADAQRQAYVNQQRSMKAMPQIMAAAGYSGGVTESNAANIMNEYQNALIDLDRSKAQELARLQANLANGIAESDTQYQIQLANAVQAAQQFEAQQEAQAKQLEMQQIAAVLEEERHRDNLALKQAELKLQRDKLNAANTTSGAGSNVKPALTYAQAQEQLAKENYSDPVMKAAEYYGLSTEPANTQRAATAAYTVPGSYAEAERMAMANNDMAPIAAYLSEKRKYDNQQVADYLNELTADREGAFFGWGR